MASVSYECKMHTATEVKAIIRHCEKEQRLKHNHNNKDINKELTQSNSSLFNLSYIDICKKYDERIKELDTTTNKNKRKDRVTCFSLEYTVPDNLPERDEENFLLDVEKLIAKQYGSKNIIESTRHFDEKHEYIDHGVKKISRAHAHTFVVPELNGKLNGKKFSSTAQIMKLNKAIDEMSREKYHVPYLTGEQARKKTAEQLKNESIIEEQQQIIMQQQTQMKVNELKITKMVNMYNNVAEKYNELNTAFNDPDFMEKAQLRARIHNLEAENKEFRDILVRHNLIHEIKLNRDR